MCLEICKIWWAHKVVCLCWKCGIMLQLLCLDNFSMMQFRQTTWLVLWSFAKASICYAKVQLLNKSGLKMAIIKQFWLWNFSFDLASLFKSHFREHLFNEFFFAWKLFSKSGLAVFGFLKQIEHFVLKNWNFKQILNISWFHTCSKCTLHFKAYEKTHWTQTFQMQAVWQIIFKKWSPFIAHQKTFSVTLSPKYHHKKAEFLKT